MSGIHLLRASLPDDRRTTVRSMGGEVTVRDRRGPVPSVQAGG